MLSETGLRLFETHMEVTEAENWHRTAHWALLHDGGFNGSLLGNPIAAHVAQNLLGPVTTGKHHRHRPPLLSI